MFQHTYTVQKGDNLSKIAARFGYSNPGPIYYYPTNSALFFRRKRAGSLLRSGDVLYIPWKRANLATAEQVSRQLIKDVNRTGNRLLRREIKMQQEMMDYLHKIDTMNFLAQSLRGAVFTAIGVKKGIEMTSEQALIWLMDGRAELAGGIISTFIVDAPHKSKRDIRFFVRHTLGPWNPSYWMSVYIAIKTKDLDIYLYGPQVLHQRNVDRIVQQSRRHVDDLKQRLQLLSAQLAMPFYQQRI